jgi:hypothetical protein
MKTIQMFCCTALQAIEPLYMAELNTLAAQVRQLQIQPGAILHQDNTPPAA